MNMILVKLIKLVEYILVQIDANIIKICIIHEHKHLTPHSTTCDKNIILWTLYWSTATYVSHISNIKRGSMVLIIVITIPSPSQGIKMSSSMLDQRFPFLNLINFRTYGVNNIMNTLPTIMDIVPSIISDTKRSILTVFKIQTVVSSSQTRM
jgi:hypothetical protein